MRQTHINVCDYLGLGHGASRYLAFYAFCTRALPQHRGLNDGFLRCKIPTVGHKYMARYFHRLLLNGDLLLELSPSGVSIGRDILQLAGEDKAHTILDYRFEFSLRAVSWYTISSRYYDEDEGSWLKDSQEGQDFLEKFPLLLNRAQYVPSTNRWNSWNAGESFSKAVGQLAPVEEWQKLFSTAHCEVTWEKYPHDAQFLSEMHDICPISGLEMFTGETLSDYLQAGVSLTIKEVQDALHG